MPDARFSSSLTDRLGTSYAFSITAIDPTKRAFAHDHNENLTEELQVGAGAGPGIRSEGEGGAPRVDART